MYHVAANSLYDETRYRERKLREVFSLRIQRFGSSFENLPANTSCRHLLALDHLIRTDGPAMALVFQPSPVGA